MFHVVVRILLLFIYMKAIAGFERESYFFLLSFTCIYVVSNLLGRTDFSDQFRKIIIRHERIGYDLNVRCDNLHA